MVFAPFRQEEGVIKTDSSYSQSGRWIDSDKVRFVRGFPEKIGGWNELSDEGGEPIVGTPRGMHAWIDNAGTQYAAWGTEKRLYVTNAMQLVYDITPKRETGNLTDPFTTVNGSSIVTVADVAHGWTLTGNRATFSGASTVGGLNMNGEWTVASILGSDSFTFVHSGTASSSATGGGTVTYSYEIDPGLVDASVAAGWGTGWWGQEAWNEPRTEHTGTLKPRIWTLQNYGEDLYACFNDSPIYVWDPDTGDTVATKLTNSPTFRTFIVTEERFVMGFCADGDQMLIKWADQDDATDWTATSTNTAGTRRLAAGSEIVGAKVLANGVTLVWTDQALYQFQYTGDQYIFNSRLAGNYCGLIGPLAVATQAGTAFWMGPDTFWIFDGTAARPIPNIDAVRQYVYSNLREFQSIKTNAGVVGKFNEVWWCYPIDDNLEPTRYIALSLETSAWVVGTLTRTCWSRLVIGTDHPLAMGTDGKLYKHEEGVDADGAAMHAYIESAPTEVNDGGQMVEIFQFIPDMQRQVGDLTLTLTAKEWPNASTSETETKTVTTTDDVIDTRLSGRQISVKIESNVVGGDFRLGKPRMDIEITAERR